MKRQACRHVFGQGSDRARGTERRWRDPLWEAAPTQGCQWEGKAKMLGTGGESEQSPEEFKDSLVGNCRT